MKGKGFLGLAAAGLFFSGWPEGAFAQGTFNFSTLVPEAGVDAPFHFSDSNPSTGPGPIYSAGLYLFKEGSLTLVPGSLTTYRDGTIDPVASKYIVPVTVAIPEAPPGSSVEVVMRMWLSAEGSYDQAIQKGQSGVLPIANLGTDAATAATFPSWFDGFTFIPEPGTLTLGLALGCTMFFAARRRTS